jgi:hypothetical protein
MMSAVLVLNADFGPLHRVSLRHAIRMLFRQVAVVHEAEPDRRIGVYPMPTVVRLVSYVVTRWRAGPRPANLWLLRQRGFDDRPRAAPLARRPQRVGEHRGGLRALQQPQGRPDAGRGSDAAAGAPVRAYLGGTVVGRPRSSS